VQWIPIMSPHTVRGTQVAFAEKYWLLTWAHKLKTGEDWYPCIHFVSVFALSYSLCSYFAKTLDSRKDRTDNIFMTMNWSHLELPPSQWGQLSQESSQIGTRLLPPGDNFPNWTRPSAWPRLLVPPVMRPTRRHPWLNCLTIHTFVPCPQFFCLLKPIAHVCTPKMAEDELSAYSAFSCGMSHAG
jgi:hypothetical protein